MRGISSGRVALETGRVIDSQLDVCWLRDVNILSTVNVDGGTRRR